MAQDRLKIGVIGTFGRISTEKPDGGTEKAYKNASEWYGCDFIFIKPHGEKIAPLGDFQRRVLAVNIVKRLPALGHIPDIIQLWKATRELDRENPTHVVFDHPSTAYGLLTYFFLSQRLKNRSVALWRYPTDHNARVLDDSGWKNRLRNLTTWPIQRRMSRYMANHMQANLVITDYVGQSLRHIGVKKPIETIVDQISIDINDGLRGNLENRRKYLADDELGVLVVHRIAPDKDIGMALQVYEQLRRMAENLPVDGKYKRIKIRVVGQTLPGREGYHDSVVANLRLLKTITAGLTNAEAITFEEEIGPLDRKSLNEVMNAYDILLATSPLEGLGAVVPEMQKARGTVVARGVCVAFRELLEKEREHTGQETGILYDSAQEAAQVIVDLMQNPDRLASMGQSGQRWASWYFSANHSEEVFMAALRRVTSGIN